MVQQITSCQNIVDRSVARLMSKTQSGGKSRKFAILNIATHKSARQTNSVKHAIHQSLASVPHKRRVNKPDVKTCVVRDQNRVANKFDKRVEHLVDCRRVGNHCFGDACQNRDERRNCAQRVYKCREPPNFFSPAIFDCADFGYRVIFV